MWKVLALAVLYAFAYGHGMLEERKETDRVVGWHRVKQAELVGKLKAAEVKREVKYVERVKVVEAVVDDCVGQRMPDEYLDILRFSGGNGGK